MRAWTQIPRWLTAVILAGTYACSAQPSALHLGLSVGVSPDRSNDMDTHYGVHVNVRASSLVSTVVTVAWQANFPDDPVQSWTGYALRGFGTVRVQPLPGRTFLHVGAGLGGSLASAREEVRALRVSHRGLAFVVVSGLRLRIGRFRPFVDVYLLDRFPEISSPETHAFLGFEVGL